MSRADTGPIAIGLSSVPDTPRKFLGLAYGKWTQMLFGLLVAGLSIIFTWAMFVRDDLKEIHQDVEHHEAHGHDKTNTAIEEIKRVQTIQSVQLENIGLGIGEIKDKLK